MHGDLPGAVLIDWLHGVPIWGPTRPPSVSVSEGWPHCLCRFGLAEEAGYAHAPRPSLPVFPGRGGQGLPPAGTAARPAPGGQQYGLAADIGVAGR